MAGDAPRSDDPQVERELAERGRALIAAAVADTSAPLGLRERLERDRERARPVARRRWLGLAGSFAAVAAAAVAALVISLGGTPSPGVLATVELAGKGPALPAPRHDPANPVVLQTKIDGLPFPDWAAKFQWRASGARTDQIKDRDATTVFYDNPTGARLAYTILGGGTIEPPDSARTTQIRGKDFHMMTRGDMRIVVWNRGGHTCVMSAPMSVPAERLLDLAAWDAGGRVPS
jgi:anti-sigma factor RsiW